MDLTSRLLLFLDVTERGSYAKAAELRNIDRSVISKQMSKLEEELGVRLLNRTTRSFSLTAAGVEVVRKAEELRENLRETVRVAQNFHTEPKGLLKISTTSALAKNVLQPVINAFQLRFPQILVELRVDDRLVDIVGEGFDIAFRVGELQDSSLIARKLARNRLMILASPEYLERYGEPKTFEELAAMPAAGYAGDNFRTNMIRYADEDNQAQEVALRITYYANEIELLMQKALSGSAFYLAPAFQITDEVTSGKLVPILTDLKLPNFNDLYAVYPHRDLPVRTRLFLDAVKDFIGEEDPIWELNVPGFDQMYGHPTRKEWAHVRW